MYMGFNSFYLVGFLFLSVFSTCAYSSRISDVELGSHGRSLLQTPTNSIIGIELIGYIVQVHISCLLGGGYTGYVIVAVFHLYCNNFGSVHRIGHICGLKRRVTRTHNIQTKNKALTDKIKGK